MRIGSCCDAAVEVDVTPEKFPTPGSPKYRKLMILSKKVFPIKCLSVILDALLGFSAGRMHSGQRDCRERLLVDFSRA